MLKGIEHRKKWEMATKFGLCYRCLGKGHLGDSRTSSRERGIDGCKDRHYWLLHEEKVTPGSMEGKTDTLVTEEKSSTYETVQEHEQRSIALRTVPVLGLDGRKEKVTINAANGQKVNLMSATRLVWRVWMVRQVWNRWMKEYLTQIGSRHKWYFRDVNLQVGNVLVIDPRTVR